MKISAKLEEMVAGLISDAVREREEVEGVLSEIADLVERFKKREVLPSPEEIPTYEPEVPTQLKSLEENLATAIKFQERRGLNPQMAEKAGKEMLGIED